MAIDTLMVYVGVYGNVADAEADYQLIKDLHTDADLIDAYDAAVIERREGGKTKIVKKHETPTRVGGVLGGGVGLATGLVVALFPFAAIGGGLIALTTAGGAALGAVAGHAAAGMSRHDLKELGEHLDAGQAGLVVVGVSDMGAKIERAMKKANKVPALEKSANCPTGRKAAPNATAMPVIQVTTCGVRNLGCTLERTSGSNPSRAMTKKIRVWPKIIIRMTVGSAIPAASPNRLPTRGW